MEDKRKNNGNKGHSTKSNKDTDKRKSKGRELLDKYIDEDVDYADYKVMMEGQLKLAKDGDTKAATFWSDRVIGKPKERTDVTTNGDSISLRLDDLVSFKE